MIKNADFRDADIFMNRDAAVKEAFEDGKISSIRYEDYLSLYEELKEKRRY